MALAEAEAELRVGILAPAAGTRVGEQISVSGSVWAVRSDNGELDSKITVTRVNSVWVTFGAGGPSVKANMTGLLTWQCVGTIPDSTPSGQAITISVVAVAAMQNRYYPPGEDQTTGSGQTSVDVLFKQKAPELTLQLTSPVTAETVPYPFRFSGTAHDGVSGISSVQYKIGNGQFAEVDNPKGDWSEWSKTVPLQYGSFQLAVKAIGNLPDKLESPTLTATVLIKEPFEPTDIDQVFASTTYLRELMEFAQRQIKIGSGGGPNPQVLASRLFQAYDALTLANAFEQANKPVAQTRIAIEVLRRALTALNQEPPAELDKRFRFLAYQNLLREMGASYEELRLARLAEHSERQTLASRLGFSLEPNRPDRLDRMTLTPDTVTDAQLEELFGYRATSQANPLTPSPLAPLLPEWQMAALSALWLAEDSRSRDAASGALPIIDPDIVSVEHIANRTAANPAFNLWNARQKWLSDTLIAIQQEGATQTAPLARFDQLVNKFIVDGLPPLDLPALAARDAQGENLSAQLAVYNLDLSAFRFLARSRSLLVAGTLLESEWQDVFAITLQVKKSRGFQQWHNEERQAGITLDPAMFLSGNSEPSEEIPAWRGSRRSYSQWRRTLLARAKQRETLENSYQTALVAAETQTLPQLRDALLELVGQRQTPPETGAASAERLSRELLIDFRAHADTKTTRVDQAIETLQGLLFSVRAGRLPVGADGIWTMNETSFDPEWVWMGSYRAWLAAIRVFAYPENQLFPNLYINAGEALTPTESFIGPNGVIDRLRKAPKVTPQLARVLAADYLADLRQKVPDAASKLPEGFTLTDQQMSAQELEDRQTLITALFNGISDPKLIPPYLREVFWLVPMALAQRLQEEREYLVALDWYQTVYAFELPLDKRKLYPGLTMEAAIPSSYDRTPEWLTEELNPHIIARTSTQNQTLVGRKNVYTRFTVMAIVRCFLAYADLEFSRNLTESVTKARTLYETAMDLLSVPELRPESGPTIPFPANPVWESLQLHAQNNLAKIHNGMNIAGVRDVKAPSGQASLFLPSQYRYAFLVERAKNLVGIAQQVEAAFLSALQQGDEETYRQIQAKHDIRVAGTSINLADLKVSDADILQREAELQKDRADIQLDHYEKLIGDGLNNYEWLALKGLEGAAALRAVKAYEPSLKKLFESGNLGELADAASAAAAALQTRAGFERRKQEWQLQKNLAQKETQIGIQQILHAKNQQQIADQERKLAGLQLDHAEAVMNFLANKFTNAELFEWMSGVLNGVYAYFLQQATALAQLAEAQLAFERQEPAPGFVRADYWIDTEANTDNNEQRDRRGLTGSARLLQDVYRLDQYAFDTDKRKLHLTQTLSLAQLGALELQQLRDTGVLTFATPETLFDREFPGHYLRLVKRVKVSLIALVPPTRGVRASLSASGLSRTVVGGDKFAPITLSRSPESIAFTSPLNATGLFELEQENGMLLPFEGMGLDAVWRLELPKPANPFDYRSIADVLLTIEYTALNSYDYRQKVLRDLDRSFSSDRAFSLRDQFADAWYELHHPEQVEPARQMLAELPVRREDFPPHVSDLRIQQITLFCVRAEGVLQEIKLVSLAQTIPGLNTVTAGEVLTQGGIVGTRRPNGAPWQALVGRHPVGNWALQLENSPSLRAAIKDESILDLVLVLTVNGTTPEWPQ